MSQAKRNPLSQRVSKHTPLGSVLSGPSVPHLDLPREAESSRTDYYQVNQINLRNRSRSSRKPPRIKALQLKKITTDTKRKMQREKCRAAG